MTATSPDQFLTGGVVSYTGIIERIMFFSEKTGFSVFVMKCEGMTPITVRGITSARFGDRVTCDGDWEVHPSYGQQFHATSIVMELPKSARGIENYLSSGVIPGVGPATAKKIVKEFGDKALEVLDEAIDLIDKVQGISKKTKDKIRNGWKEHSAMRNIIVLLRGYEISQAMAYRIYRTYKGEAMDILKSNPWQMARDVNGIGFKKADEIAVGMGAPLGSLNRIGACLSFVVEDAAKSGHCGLPIKEVITQTAGLLTLPQETVENALTRLTASPFVTDGEMAWNTRLYFMERDIGKFMAALASRKPSWHIANPHDELVWVEKKTGSVLADNQRNALLTQLSSPVMIVTGGPGCGKTFLLNSILSILQKHRLTVLLAAPTGKAAVRMTEATGIAASTLHRLLKIGHGNDVPEKLDCDLLVIDESSMVDIPLFHKVIQALPAKSGLLLVGDADQLPSVGAGSVLNDLILSGKVPCVRLNKVFRQAQGSKIILNAHRINQGEAILPQERSDDFFFIETATPEDAATTIRDLIVHRLPKAYGFNPTKDIQVLCPMNRSACGTASMNLLLQQNLNPLPVASVNSFGTRIGVGDRVMQTVNNYAKGVFNGDSGYVESISGDAEVIVRFPVGNVAYNINDVDELILSYAMTIHKSQGSDFPVVIVPLLTSHFVMLQRNLIYTGLTRARKLCILVGQKKALWMAIKNNKASQRNTRLSGLLK